MITSSPRSGVSLYVHIPFCTSRCDYCDFFTRTGVPDTRKGAIVEGIATHIAYELDRLDRPYVPTVYFGGGTPSVLSRRLLSKLFSTVERYAPRPLEFTMECNPEDIDSDFLSFLSDSPVTRLSLGVQSLHRRLRTRIGRKTGNGGDDEILKALYQLSSRWKGRWSADLIAAIPGEARDEALYDIDRLLSLSPPHLSVYELGIEESTMLGLRSRRGSITPDSEEIVADRLDLVKSHCTAAGLEQYEISNFAEPGEESQHNLKYWEMYPYVGAGPGSVGTSVAHAPNPYVVRRTTGTDFARFLSDPSFGVTEEAISSGELAVEFFLMGLRLKRGLDGHRFSRIFGMEPWDLIPETMGRWENRFRISPEEGRLRLDGRGRSILNRIMVDIFDEVVDHRFLTMVASEYVRT